MSTNKIKTVVGTCVVLLLFLLLLWLLSGIGTDGNLQITLIGYEDRIFQTKEVHDIRIIMDDWEGFLQTCADEVYTPCTVIIDEETFHNVGIRAKGNSSLTAVSEMGSCRYSLKLEFDHYDSSQNYHGLDKLDLNNLIQDNTMMKDYLAYQLMREMNVPSPLCSYTKVYINGKSLGLYLAVEAIEESFLLRNYGSDYGDLYKPDADNSNREPEVLPSDGKEPPRLNGEELRQALEEQRIPTDRLEVSDWNSITPEQLPELLSKLPGVDVDALLRALMNRHGSPDDDPHLWDVKLQYIDDRPDSYPNIFNNAKTNITAEDKTRFIQALKRLSTGKKLSSTVNLEAVILYFAVHNFVCNEDSYTGSTVHNYYLYEKDGKLSMLPWDYNLAFGGVPGGSASSVVNAPVMNPVSGGSYQDRPMLAWILDNESYAWIYQRYLSELLKVDMEALVTQTQKKIAPYVLRDPTKFCTYAEFETAVDTLRQFLELRIESVQLQLKNQPANIEVGDLDLSAMGGVGPAAQPPRS